MRARWDRGPLSIETSTDALPRLRPWLFFEETSLSLGLLVGPRHMDPALSIMLAWELSDRAADLLALIWLAPVHDRRGCLRRLLGRA